MRGYRDLRVWQESKAFSVRIYELTLSGPWDRDWGLRDQMRRASVSVPSNIAEGDARQSQRDSVRFFKIALGSLAELSTQLEIAFEIGYLLEAEHESLQSSLTQIRFSLGALVKKRSESI